MAKVLVQVVSGPENAPRAALGFLVAKGALDSGHDVTVFLLADGVQFLHPETREAIAGLGGGPLSQQVDALKNGGAKFYASKMSRGARGVTDEVAAGLGAEPGTPEVLVELSLDSDTVLIY